MFMSEKLSQHSCSVYHTKTNTNKVEHQVEHLFEGYLKH